MSTLVLTSIGYAALIASILGFIYLLFAVLCKGQPKGLLWLGLANTGERFGYYTMLAVFALFLGENFGFTESTSSIIYASFLGLVYFLPVIGGVAADLFGYGKMVISGIFIMLLGYLLLSAPLGGDTPAIVAMGFALLLVSFGTGLFKGNLQVMVGKLYDSPEFADKRDSGFSLFYMLINVGAMVAPTAAIEIMNWAQHSWGISKADSYHFAFGVACVSLVLSIAIYLLSSASYRHVLAHEKGNEKAEKTKSDVPELTREETRERITCLVLVFAVVIFFWMAFHQNGLTLTFFARDYVQTSSTGVQSMMFNVVNLWAVVGIVYGIYCFMQATESFKKFMSLLVGVVSLAIIVVQYFLLDSNGVKIEAPIFQQFNPLFVVALTPISVALFSFLAKKGKEPSSPRKIGLGMLVAALGFIVMIVASTSLLSPMAQKQGIEAGAEVMRVSPNWLVSTYLVLTFAELLLSPIGISFVTKVAPPKYAGLMMGLWFAATAIGNFLVQVPGLLWDADVKLIYIWGTLAGICLLSALFIFSILKKLEKVA
ncbi:MAG: peptide MFS transporter [Bacteroidaceae bacterium]|nr:peptide MFS transporter [Bacteroidaceae bacterium]